MNNSNFKNTNLSENKNFNKTKSSLNNSITFGQTL